MSTYALFIATNPDPVSDTQWASLDQVFDRARLSSGGTRVVVRSAEHGTSAEDYRSEVATFVNGIHLEVRDDGQDAFSFFGDGRLLGTATRERGEWSLVAAPSVPVPVPNPVATLPEGTSREEAQATFGGFVEDWLE